MAAYVACALVQYHAVLSRLDSSVMAGTDGTLFTWWIRWLPHALGHGLNPFVTHAINAPFGANGMWNTSVPLLALLAAPVTVSAGPVVATNLLFVVAPAASAAIAFFVLRRYADGFGSFVGGLMFGFSPFIATTHLHLMWSVLPPLLLVFLEEIFVRQRRSPEAVGVLLGLSCVAQLLISSEVLASSAVVAAIAVVAIALYGRRRIRTHLPRAARSIAAAAVTFAVVGGWPAYTLFFGPQRVSGEIQPPGRYVADLVEFVTPSGRQILSPAGLRGVYSSFSGNLSEHSAYLGLPLIVALLAIAWRRRRAPLVRVTAITTLVAAVASLGPRLTIGGVQQAVPLPWALVQDAPLLRNLLPARLSVHVMMGAAVLVAIELSRQTRRRDTARFIPIALLLAALGPLVPVTREPAPLPETPAFFTKSAEYVEPASTVVIEPYAHPGNAAPMLWQARAGMRFSMPGGYVITQAEDEKPQFWPPSTPLRNVSILLEKGEPPRLTGALRVKLTSELRDLRACAVVIGPHRDRAGAVAFFTDLLGQLPRYEAGVWLFELPGCGRGAPRGLLRGLL